MELSGEQIEQFRDALCAAFTHNTIEQMVRFKLGLNLWDIVSNNPLQQVAFDLISWSEKTGRVESLIRAVHVSRPDNRAVQAFMAKYCPQLMVAVSPRDQAVAATRGLEALAKCVSGLDDPAVRQIIGRSQRDLEMAREKSETLGRYKALHDQMHVLSTKYVRQIAQAAALFRKSEEQLELLEGYALQLKGDTDRIRAVALKLRSYRAEKDWIDSLSDASSVLETPSERTDEELARAVEAIRRVLREEPIRINGLLCDNAGDLRLRELSAMMTEIEAIATQQGGPLPIEDLRKGFQNLTLLQPRLAGLVEEHFEWQWLDKELAAAAALPGSTPEVRFSRWELFQKRLLVLCGLSYGKEWADSLAKQIPLLKTTGEATQFSRTFNRFRTLAADRFFNVDAELRDISDELSHIAQPLDQLLRFLTNGPVPAP